jgi:hypothetical protein
VGRKEVISLLDCGITHHLSGWLESARKSGKIKPREETNITFKMMKGIVPSWTSGIPAERSYDETGTVFYPMQYIDYKNYLFLSVKYGLRIQQGSRKYTKPQVIRLSGFFIV